MGRTMPRLSVRRRQAEGEARVIEEEDLAFTAKELDDLVSKSASTPPTAGGSRRGPPWRC